MRRLVFALLALLAASTTKAQFSWTPTSGHSECPGQPDSCSATLACDIGTCCGGLCTSNYTVLAQGDNCTANADCTVCGSGLVCNFTTGTCVTESASPSTSPRPFDAGCACANSSQCWGGCFAVNGGAPQCLNDELAPGDQCLVDGQCKSGACAGGVCVGKAAGVACSGDNEECAMGLVCTLAGTCGAGVAPGGTCEYDGECATSLDVCTLAAGCVPMMSVVVGGQCNEADLQCVPPAVCNMTYAPGGTDGVCVAVTGVQCAASDCGEFESCECGGARGTECVLTYPPCASETSDLVACVASNCQVTIESFFETLDEMFYVVDTGTCLWQHCSAPVLAYFCCSECTTPGPFGFLPAGFDCAAPSFTAPEACCTGDWTQCPFELGSCQGGGTATTATAATTGPTTAATTGPASTAAAATTGAAASTPSRATTASASSSTTSKPSSTTTAASSSITTGQKSGAAALASAAAVSLLGSTMIAILL